MAEVREMGDKTKLFRALEREALPEDVKELRAKLIKTIANAFPEPQMVHVTCLFLTASQKML